MKLLALGALFCLTGATLAAQGQTKCQASVNGYRIRTVYVTGDHFNGVVWAYKHLSEETCLTPVTDATKADAILELIDPNAASLAAANSSYDPLTVSCSSSMGASTCIDSNGYELTVECDGFGNCSSYYGPSLAGMVLQAFDQWMLNAPYQGEARLYTSDHKLIWKSEDQRGHGPHETLWMDKLRLGTLSPPCKMPGAFGWSKYKTYRHWATTTCGIAFEPSVSIDIKANARAAQKLAAIDQKRTEADEMKRNAADAAAKQQSATHP